jgi:hypothetical protein
MNKFWEKITNLFKREWELFQFMDSVDAMNMSNYEFDKNVERIKKKYKSK